MTKSINKAGRDYLFSEMLSKANETSKRIILQELDKDICILSGQIFSYQETK